MLAHRELDLHRRRGRKLSERRAVNYLHHVQERSEQHTWCHEETVVVSESTDGGRRSKRSTGTCDLYMPNDHSANLEPRWQGKDRTVKHMLLRVTSLSSNRRVGYETYDSGVHATEFAHVPSNDVSGTTP